MPDDIHIQGEVYSYKQFLYNTSIVTDHGINNLVDAFSKQIAGRVSSVPYCSPVAYGNYIAKIIYNYIIHFFLFFFVVVFKFKLSLCQVLNVIQKNL